MKKRDLKKLALLGLLSGAMLSKAPLAAAAGQTPSTTNAIEATIQANNESNMNYHLMTEDELLLELSPEGEADYDSLTPEGKQMAQRVASQMCNGTNECKGLNACKTDNNDCAGKGACKGQGKCAFSDKNLAVKVVKEKMKAKRAALSK
ncbi:hypothetical protein [Estrella lausannensis]|uniref:Conserved putative secreted protein n=1 Tax=Estrella lausannensis TaxID=483423 RepID=A0A0H5DMU8_9BACT|nr:hypothetical protein [Estrella lausannensis]CRX37491.1 Conserved putative secreted protein [Estrella lausannensis]